MSLFLVCGVTLVVWCLLWSWRMKMAHDSTKNNHGLFQWSGVFYKGSNDFINALPYICNLAPLLTVYVGIYLRYTTGNDYYTFFTFFAGFVLVPLVDLVVGEDSYNPTAEEESRLRHNSWFVFHLRLFCYAYCASVVGLAYYVGLESGFVDGRPNNLSTTALIGMATSLGITAGFGIGCIHELIHRPNHTDLNHARMVLVFANFNHFWVEHVWGHHRRVATDEDPASSALNEPFWTFIWCCLYKSFISACHLEAKFLKDRRWPWWHANNRILWPFMLSFIIDFAIYALCGPQALMCHLIQSFLAAFLCDNANYIEHYGLRRERKSDKKDEWGLYNDYERPGWMHAWNTGERLTNWILFKIERHPDHHVNAGRPYQILRTFKESPTYPTGYAGMFVLSWFPPLFFWVMNPLVRKAQEDYKQQMKDGSYKTLFPLGANNISSVYQKIGEDFHEAADGESEDEGEEGKCNEVMKRKTSQAFEKHGPTMVRKKTSEMLGKMCPKKEGGEMIAIGEHMDNVEAEVFHRTLSQHGQSSKTD